MVNAGPQPIANYTKAPVAGGVAPMIPQTPPTTTTTTTPVTPPGAMPKPTGIPGPGAPVGSGAGYPPTGATTPPGAPGAGNAAPPSNKKMKKGMSNTKKIGVVVGLFLFLAMSLAAVFFTFRTQDVEQPIAPTRPLAGACSVSFTVAPPTDNLLCTKGTFANNTDHEPRNPVTEFIPTQAVLYEVTATNQTGQRTAITLSDTIELFDASGAPIPLADYPSLVKFEDSTCAGFTVTANTFTCTIPDVPPADTVSAVYWLRILTDIPENMTIDNTAGLTADATGDIAQCVASVTVEVEPEPTPTPTPTPTPSPVACDEACTVSTDCEDGLICHTSSTCRLPDNPTSATCQPVPEPAECNETCSSDSDCASDLICDDTSNTCRLEENPTSATCDRLIDCNDACTSDSQCQDANSGYVCSSQNGNVCRLDSNRSSATCQPAAQTYACNSTCTSNANCATIGSNYFCYKSSSGNRCRLDSNPSSSSCKGTVTPSPTPKVGCNETCTSNSDCVNAEHICTATSQGNRCRLADYTNSESCTAPTVTKGGSPAPLPEKLPVAGSSDVIKGVVAGVGVLILGILTALLVL